MKKFLYSVAFISFCISTTKAQKFVNEFLNIGVGARAHGMFGSVVASTNDGTAAYWNTAGLTDINSPLQVNAMHAKWFGGIANYDYVSIAKKLSGDHNQVASFSFIRLGVDNIPYTINLVGADGTIDYNNVSNFSAADYAGLFSYARTIDRQDKLAIGGNIKVVHRSVGSFGKAWGFGADLGLKYKWSENFTLGVSARDITTTFNAWSFNLTDDIKTTFATTNNEIPVSSSEVTLPRLIFGGAYRFQKGNFSYLGELDLNFSTNGTKAGLVSSDKFNIDPSIGIEIGYAEKVYLRAGLGNMQSVINPVNTSERVFEVQPNMGLGLKLGRLKIDYALANVGNSGGVLVSHIFSLGIDFVPRQ